MTQAALSQPERARAVAWTGRMRLALGVLLAFVTVAVAAPWLPLANPSAMDMEARLQPPQLVHAPVLGTDSKGRDLLSRAVSGARVSLGVGLLGSLVALLVGIPFGAIAGMRGGRTDRWMMRFADFLEGIPLAVIVVFLLSVLQEYRAEFAAIGLGRIHVFFVAVGLLFWLPTARIARAEALRIRQTAYVAAAHSIGARAGGVFWRHYIPNLMPSAFVMLGLTLPRVVLMEAFLSFLGLGVEAPAVSWGLLASEGMAAINPLVDSAWLLWVPAGFLCVSLFCLNVLADGLRDQLGRS